MKSASIAPCPALSLCACVPGFHVLRECLTSLLHRQSQAFASRFFAPGKLLFSSFPSALFYQCDECLSPFGCGGYVAGLPEIASHGNNLHQGAGCQQ